MKKQCDKYPTMPAGVNPFRWILDTAHAMRETQTTIARAQRAIAQRRNAEALAAAAAADDALLDADEAAAQIRGTSAAQARKKQGRR